MAKRDPRVDEYIEKSAAFARPILRHLRRVVHLGCPQVQETIKWSFPHFVYKWILCSVAAFKHHCAFGFWKAELVFAGDKRAKKHAMGHFGPITSLADLPPEKTLIGYVQKAADLNEAGTKSPSTQNPQENRQRRFLIIHRHLQKSESEKDVRKL